MSVSAFKEWDVELESDGTEWSGFLGNSGVSPGIAAAMIRRQDSLIIEYNVLFKDHDER